MEMERQRFLRMDHRPRRGAGRGGGQRPAGRGSAPRMSPDQRAEPADPGDQGHRAHAAPGRAGRMRAYADRPRVPGRLDPQNHAGGGVRQRTFARSRFDQAGHPRWRGRRSRRPAEHRRAGGHPSGTVLRLTHQTLRVRGVMVAVAVITRGLGPAIGHLLGGDGRRPDADLAHGRALIHRTEREMPGYAFRAHAVHVYEPEQERRHPQHTQRPPRRAAPRHNKGRPGRNHAVTLALVPKRPRRT